MLTYWLYRVFSTSSACSTCSLILAPSFLLATTVSSVVDFSSQENQDRSGRQIWQWLEPP